MTSWAAGSLFYDTGYYGYENPYYVPAATTTVVEYPVYDYSQPIVTTTVPPDMTAPAAVTAVSESEQARDAFSQGDYNRALAVLDAALAKTPDDVVLHEFRALALFAMQCYKEAAGTLYAVLSVGPGWDWTTMSGLYQSTDTYTQQLRELESYVKKNPNAPEGHFVLAYQYTTAGQADPAASQFKEVSRLLPKDQVSQQMAALLSPSDRQPPAEVSERRGGGDRATTGVAAEPRRKVEGPRGRRRRSGTVVKRRREIYVDAFSRRKIEIVRGDLSACRRNAGNGIQ